MFGNNKLEILIFLYCTVNTHSKSEFLDNTNLSSQSS